MSRGVVVVALWWALTVAAAPTVAMAQVATAQDSDRDGLSDALEAELLRQFEPRWMVGKDDCSVRPARFAEGVAQPTVVEDDGTVYGQAFPVRSHGDEVELHFYQLWRRDCGQMGHPLDAEHVAVLLRRDDGADGQPKWRAVYWYAAAHEDTVCDASQMTRASTLKAEDKGATVWVSPGKHASFLSEELCSHGCGGDRCVDMERMKTAEVVNVGELSRPMDGAMWVSFAGWPLAEKMRRSDFGEARVERLERLPETDVAWANPSKRPAQAAIYGGNSALNGVAVGEHNTDTALVLANDKTSGALDSAQKSTGNALTKSYRNVVKALGGAAKSTGKAGGVETGEEGAPH
ncbi:hypothetical protein [Edaphobacter aggregans]|uniref:hypothetical protein n=1 Tax=Edaphobacter aggregans TaxID=570835 RepID=UPI00068AF6FB|nr:hypothetical protein [Edaphobacter aggregans]